MKWVGAHAKGVRKTSAEEEIPLASGIFCSLNANECLHTDLGVIILGEGVEGKFPPEPLRV